MRGYEYLLVCSAYMLSERESTYELLQHHIWEWRRWWKRYKDDIWSTSSCRLPCRSQTSGTWCWWRLASPPQPRKLKNLLSEIFYITSTNFGIRDFLYYHYRTNFDVISFFKGRNPKVNDPRRFESEIITPHSFWFGSDLALDPNSTMFIISIIAVIGSQNIPVRM